MVSHRSGGVGPLAVRAGAAGLTLALLLLPLRPVAAAVADACSVPDAYLAMPPALERTESRISKDRRVRVVILGTPIAPSAGAHTPLEGALERRLPGINFEVVEAPSPGVAEDDFEWLRSLVSRNAPDLVIWQVGVRDAMAASDVEEFEEVLGEASAWIDRRGPDLILVDPPFVPDVPHERLYVPYVGEIGEMSREEGVPVLRRYAAMQYLASEAARRPAAAGRPRCMPELMAEAIVRAVGK